MPRKPAFGPESTPEERPGSSMSSTQRAYRELRERIIRGHIAPGERLKVEGLKVTLQTGASPIREALSLLTSDQLVERIDQRGFRAAPASEAHFREILSLRCRLEGMALTTSVEQGDADWEERLVLAHHRLAQAHRSDADIDRWEALHKAFHLTLLDACGSSILLRFCEQLYDLNVRYRFLAGRATGYERRDVSLEHVRILETVIARDAELAARCLVEHYTRTGDFLGERFASRTPALA